jgi:BASS family bile acid:Na+ symporter
MLRQIVIFILQNLIFAMLLATGLHTPVDGFRQAFRKNGGVIARTVLMANVVVPLIAMLLVAILPLTNIAKGVILIASICPGAHFVIHRFRGQAYLPQVTLVVISLLAVVTVPLWTTVLGRIYQHELAFSGTDVFLFILRALLLPLGIGMAIRHFWPKVALPLGKVADIFFKVGLVLALVLTVVAVFKFNLGPQTLRAAQPSGVLAIVLFTLGAALLGHWAGRPDPDTRTFSATLVASGNPALILAVISSNFPNLRVGSLVVFLLAIRLLTLLPYQMWMKHRRSSPPASKHPSRPAGVPAVHAPG